MTENIFGEEFHGQITASGDPIPVTASRVEPDIIDRTAAQFNDITADAPIDQVATILDKLEGLAKRIREIREAGEPRVIEWIQKNGEIKIGGVRYYVAPDKTEKDRNHKDTIEALAASPEIDGNFQLLADCLSVNAVKPGAARKILKENFGEFFETIRGDKLKVQKIDEKFLK